MPTAMHRLSVFSQRVRDNIKSVAPPLNSNSARHAQDQNHHQQRLASSGLDFQDASLPDGFSVASQYQQQYSQPSQQQQYKHADIPTANQVFPKTPEMRKNRAELARLQGLMVGHRQRDSDANSDLKSDSTASLGALVAPNADHGSKMDKLRHWFINEGGRRTFFAVWILVHALVFAFGFLNYQYKDNLKTARATYGWTYPVARSAALVLHVEVAFLLLPVCRGFITLIRRTQLNAIIPFDANITFHKSIGWGLLIFSTIHTLAHVRNVIRLAIVNGTGFKGFMIYTFLLGPTATGWIMTACLCIMVWYAREKKRRQNFERFWYSHHLYVIFFAAWQLHGMFCMIPTDDTQKCDYWQVGVFWKYFLVSGIIFVWERILREVRARHRTYISKVIEHPGGVVEVQIKKEKTSPRAGQYIFINCPDISYWQWHPFTLTSAPEEDFISVNIKMVGDWTKAFGKALGADPYAASGGGGGGARGAKGAGAAKAGANEKGGKKEGPRERLDNVIVDNAPLKRILPRVMIDGPFGSASEDYHKFEVVMLCAAGIGVTPFASILKSIWYRLNYPQPGNKTRLLKVYFIHICRDTASVSWFRSLLAALEAQDTNGSIEIMTYVTQKMKDDDLHNIMVSDVGSEKDTISGLRAPTHYGRPNWDQIFSSVRDKHPNTEVGTIFCGPKALGSTLHKMCNKWSSGDEDGTRFIWGKENF